MICRIECNKWHNRRNIGIWILAAVWGLSLAGGMFLFYKTDLTLSTKMLQTAATTDISFSGHLVVLILPFLISVYCSCHNMGLPILLLCSLKALVVGWCMIACLYTYGNAGWLIIPFLLFSDFFGIFQLFLIWRSFFNSRFHNGHSVLMIHGAFTLAVALADHYCISRYLIYLLQN